MPTSDEPVSDLAAERAIDPAVAEVYPRVRQAIADALACDVERVGLEARLIDDLAAESIDFLDILFRLERGFKIKIPQGKILSDARGGLLESEFERDGVLTPAGLARLREVLSEVPAERFRPGLKLADVPRLFTVETFCRIVVRALASRERLS
ncbi:MAG TPA: phosphopantetheine-binding protein [Candidatus Bathyarchaeia archaeon]|nr:phosphopantetheine-binding protein [Candidatus Bathyarchaeia archaeon]